MVWVMFLGRMFIRFLATVFSCYSHLAPAWRHDGDPDLPTSQPGHQHCHIDQPRIMVIIPESVTIFDHNPSLRSVTTYDLYINVSDDQPLGHTGRSQYLIDAWIITQHLTVLINETCVTFIILE